MKQVAINLQTTVFLFGERVLGAYDRHSNMLAYKKPDVTVDELTEMVAASESLSKNPGTMGQFQTDSFSIAFWDDARGCDSTFHEVMAERPAPTAADLKRGPMHN